MISATILNFPRKRGRPKSAHRGSDSGTPELVMKRLLGETAETLDLCLERGILTSEQHWCGIHLRWLYTLRHGVPSVRAMDPTHFGGIEIKIDDQEWRIAREKEYHEAIKKIGVGGYTPLIMGICVYNERPAFLKARSGKLIALSKNAVVIIENLRNGLDILATHWERRNSTHQ